jgi:hypothetical protein
MSKRPQPDVMTESPDAGRRARHDRSGGITMGTARTTTNATRHANKNATDDGNR